jgi:hypothetical protein
MEKMRRRWAVAYFSTTRDAGQVLALHEPLIPLDGYGDLEPDVDRPALRCGGGRRVPLVVLNAVHKSFTESDETSIEVRGRQVVVWRALRRPVDDFVALARTAATLHERIEASGRPPPESSRARAGDAT